MLGESNRLAMKTDKQVYKILAACPQWFFDLTKIESPGPCSFRSMAFKEVIADGVLEPEISNKPNFVVEFQAQSDETVYPRIALEMALLQRQRPTLKIEGVILFLDSSLDSKREPWCRMIQSFSVVEQLAELQKSQPDHPMVAVFSPLIIDNQKQLESEAVSYYNNIADSGLDQLTQQVLVDVFVSWLLQRFCENDKQEIEKMLYGALPDLTETQSGKDLIQIGVLRGKAEGEAKGKAEGEAKGKAEGEAKGKAEGEAKGKRDSLLLCLEFRFGEVPEATKIQLASILSAERLDELIRQALKIKSIEDFQI